MVVVNKKLKLYGESEVVIMNRAKHCVFLKDITDKDDQGEEIIVWSKGNSYEIIHEDIDRDMYLIATALDGVYGIEKSLEGKSYVVALIGVDLCQT